MDFKDRFKEILVEHEINAMQLSKILNIDHTSLYDYLLGSLPKINNAVVIANYFNCSLNYLFGLDAYQASYEFKKEFDKEIFFDRYNAFLTERNISHHKLCKDTGVNQSSLWLWKNGGFPKSDSLIKIAKYLNCTIDYLIGRSDTQ